MLIKICGIKTLSSALAATSAGADFLGFNFVPTSERVITEEVAKEIIAGLSGAHPRIVGVFQNQPLNYVNDVADRLDLDFVQLHGDETAEYCAFINRPVIKVFSVDAGFDAQAVMKQMEPYRAHYFMLDRKNRTGEILKGEKVTEVAKEFSIILAGGLTPENVKGAAAHSGDISVVDVAGGVETNGEKDAEKIKKFVVEARD